MIFGDETVINTPRNVRIMAEAIYDSGVKPEIELFDSGDIELARHVFRPLAPPAGDGVAGAGGEIWLCRRRGDHAVRSQSLPANVAWTGFGIGRAAFPMLAQAYILGGHVRIGMEDTVYVDRGRLTSGNTELVEKACLLVTKLGGEIASAEEARDILELRRRPREQAPN